MEVSFSVTREARSNPVEGDQHSISGAAILEWLGGGSTSAAGVTVNTDTAMTVPAFFGGVNFLAGTLAGLPIHVYKREKKGRTRAKINVGKVLHDAVNDEMSSFEWRKWFFESVFTGGRGLSYIERDARKQVINIWPMNPANTVVKRKNGRKIYEYTEEGGKKKTYSASEVIDVPFMLKSDGISHRGPVTAGKDIIGMAIAATTYASKFFQNGGVPPFAITGNFQSTAALKRAASDLEAAVRKAAKENRQALTMPTGLDIKTIGVDPEKSQLADLQKFLVVQIARLLSLPPTFLQDLSNGTFSNTEQQDLHLTKHTIKRWVEHFEQELNLKIFGRGNNKYYIEMNVDGLLRGDFKTRMEGFAKAISVGHYQPAETRNMDNLPFVEGTDQNFIQGAMVPIQRAGEHLDKGVTPPALKGEPSDVEED